MLVADTRTISTPVRPDRRRRRLDGRRRGSATGAVRRGGLRRTAFDDAATVFRQRADGSGRPSRPLDGFTFVVAADHRHRVGGRRGGGRVAAVCGDVLKPAATVVAVAVRRRLDNKLTDGPLQRRDAQIRRRSAVARQQTGPGHVPSGGDRFLIRRHRRRRPTGPGRSERRWQRLTRRRWRWRRWRRRGSVPFRRRRRVLLSCQTQVVQPIGSGGRRRLRLAHRREAARLGFGGSDVRRQIAGAFPFSGSSARRGDSKSPFARIARHPRHRHRAVASCDGRRIVATTGRSDAAFVRFVVFRRVVLVKDFRQLSNDLLVFRHKCFGRIDGRQRVVERGRSPFTFRIFGANAEMRFYETGKRTTTEVVVI